MYAFYTGTSIDNILFVLFKKGFVEGSNNQLCNFVHMYYYNFNLTSDYDDAYIDLEDGVYYIGCYGN